MMKIWATLAMGIAASVTVPAAPASASASASQAELCVTPECKCAQRDSCELTKASDVVVRALVTKVEPSAKGLVNVTVRVKAVLKGSGRAIKDVDTADSSAACGVVFTPGTEYLIFGTAKQGGTSMTANSCSGTRPWASVTPDDRTTIKKCARV